jgi:hypothetical protein
MKRYGQIFVSFFLFLISIAIVLVFLSYSNSFCKDTTVMTKKKEEIQKNVKDPKLAFLVGIDNYKYSGETNFKNLKGAVNDVKILKELLVERFGFPDDEEHILVLTDNHATRDAILNGIREHLIAKANNQSVVVFQYSGHGSQLKDVHDDEIDGWDETIVPYDSGHKDPFPNSDITDDELFDLLNQLTEKTPNVTLIFDSCHSGTITRGAGIAREVERDERTPTGQRPASGIITRGVDKGKSGLHPTNSRHAVISGSTSAERAYEMEANGNHYGTLTWYLVEQLRKSGQDATYRDIMDLVKNAVTAKYWAQHPQLEGPGEDQVVFSTNSLPPSPYVLTKSNPDGSIRLAAGQVQGVTRGSSYDIYAPGTKSFGTDVKSIARVEITDVEITYSGGKLTKGGPVPDASRAVEREHHWPSPVARVHFLFEDPITKFSAPPLTLQKILDEIRNFKHIEIVSTDSDYDLLLREQMDTQTGKRYIITEGGDPIEISPRVPVDESDCVTLVVEQIKQWAKWFNVLRINNQNPDIDIEFVLRPQESVKSRGSLENREVSFSLLEGEGFTAQIKNKSRKDLYIALIDLSSDGSVNVVFPENGAEEFMEPERALTKALKTGLPKGRNSIRDVLKLIATTSYADFNFLRQAAVKGEQKLAIIRGKPTNPMEELLSAAVMGTTRGDNKNVNVGNWTTIERVLEVKRKP